MPLPNDLPPWAVGNYAAGPSTWAATARRVVTGITAFAAAGLEPDSPTFAQSFNEWLGLVQEWIEFHRNESAISIYGDGSDGAVVLGAGSTVLTRDMYYSSLTIPAGAALRPEGYRIFVTGLLSIAATGSINHTGAAASAGIEGAGASSGVLLGGGTGGIGITGPGGGAPGGGGTSAVGSIGGAGGDAGAQVGGAAGAATAPVATLGGFRHQHAALGYLISTAMRGGGGGGSGAVEGGTTGVSGAGGGGAGLLSIWARQIDNLGTITVAGGAGGAATLGDSTNVGGGGGGGGGFAWLVYREATLGTITVTGGAGGAAAGGGVAGTAGTDGAFVTLSG